MNSEKGRLEEKQQIRGRLLIQGGGYMCIYVCVYIYIYIYMFPDGVRTNGVLAAVPQSAIFFMAKCYNMRQTVVTCDNMWRHTATCMGFAALCKKTCLSRPESLSRLMLVGTILEGRLDVRYMRAT